MINTTTVYDTIIVGGGVAGLTAATALARAHRNTLLIDNHQQSNRISHAAHSVFTRDKVKPDELYQIAREQLSAYPSVRMQDDTVIQIDKSDDLFIVSTAAHETFTAKTILLSQGMNYIPPNIAGMKELFGTKAWHCPYCDGYEAHGKRVLGIFDEETREHMESLLPVWISDLTIKPPAQIREVSPAGDGVHVEFKDGTSEQYDQLAVQTTLTKRDNLAESLGCVITDDQKVQANEDRETAARGVFSAGDQEAAMTQISTAIASGHIAASSINNFLISTAS